MKNKIFIMLLRFLAIIIFLLGIFPLYFAIKPTGNSGRRVQEITDKSYRELQETDEMYGKLLYGAKVTDIYVDQQLGDAYVYVYVEVPINSADEFAEWLEKEGKHFSQEENIFSFTYFVGDDRTNFGEYEEPSGPRLFDYIFWGAAIFIFILILIPFEIYTKNTKSNNQA